MKSKRRVYAAFGGIAMCKQSPVSGLWKEDKKIQDEIILVEVMTDSID